MDPDRNEALCFIPHARDRFANGRSTTISSTNL